MRLAELLSRTFVVLFFLLYVAVAAAIFIALLKPWVAPLWRKLFPARARHRRVRSTERSDAHS